MNDIQLRKLADEHMSLMRSLLQEGALLRAEVAQLRDRLESALPPSPEPQNLEKITIEEEHRSKEPPCTST